MPSGNRSIEILKGLDQYVCTKVTGIVYLTRWIFWSLDTKFVKEYGNLS